MEIGERRERSVVVLSPVGRIDNDTSPGFQARLLAATAPAGSAVLVDFSRVNYLSSAGLRALMMGARQAKAGNGRFAVAELNAVVSEIFAISRFGHVVDVFASTAEALAALGAAARPTKA